MRHALIGGSAVPARAAGGPARQARAVECRPPQGCASSATGPWPRAPRVGYVGPTAQQGRGAKRACRDQGRCLTGRVAERRVEFAPQSVVQQGGACLGWALQVKSPPGSGSQAVPCPLAYRHKAPPGRRPRRTLLFQRAQLRPICRPALPARRYTGFGACCGAVRLRAGLGPDGVRSAARGASRNERRGAAVTAATGVAARVREHRRVLHVSVAARQRYAPWWARSVTPSWAVYSRSQSGSLPRREYRAARSRR